MSWINLSHVISAVPRRLCGFRGVKTLCTHLPQTIWARTMIFSCCFAPLWWYKTATQLKIPFTKGTCGLVGNSATGGKIPQFSCPQIGRNRAITKDIFKYILIKICVVSARPCGLGWFGHVSGLQPSINCISWVPFVFRINSLFPQPQGMVLFTPGNPAREEEIFCETS